MQLKLKVLNGKSAGKEIPVTKKRFLIGRTEGCNLRLKSDSVSRNHCLLLVRDDETVVVRDLNSRNGTLVNGQRIKEDQTVESGNQLQIGKMEFEVLIKTKQKQQAAQPGKPAPVSPGEGHQSSEDFDINEWLDEGEPSEAKKGEPETRQFQLDETDRIALEKSKEEAKQAEEEENPTEGRRFARPGRSPGKLPERPSSQSASSKEAASDMLRKFFQNR